MPIHPLAQDVLLRVTRGMDARELRDWIFAFWHRIAEVERIAARETRRPCAQDDLERLDLPIDAGGGVLLYRPSVGGMNWLRTNAAEWWGNDVRRYTLALAYVCAHREKNALATCRTKAGAWLRIKAWAFAARTSEEALRRAALALLPPPDDSLKWFAAPGDSAGDGEELDLMQVALLLSKKTGQPPEYWLWEASDDDFWGGYCSLLDEAEAQDWKHESPTCWWRRQRRALLKAETELQAATAAWKKERAEKAAKKAAKNADNVKPPLDTDAPDARNESGLKKEGSENG